MKKTALHKSALLFLAASSFTAPSANAYMRSVHFYTTAVMATWCGFDDHPFQSTSETQAVALAWSNDTTDTASETSAGSKPSEWLNPNKTADRQHFHFRTNTLEEKTVRASSIVIAPMGWTIERSQPNDPAIFEMGISLHSFQDSFAHEGFGARVGHWNDTSVDLPYKDTPKAMQMAEGTYNAMDQLHKKIYGTGCKTAFADISGIYEAFTQIKGDGMNSFDQLWEKNAEAVMKRTVPMSVFDKDRELLAQFLTASRWIRKGGKSTKRVDPTEVNVDQFFDGPEGVHMGTSL